MGMVERKMRFSAEGWRLIQAEAEIEGVSATEFVRMAAVLYAIYLRTRREGPNAQLDALRESLRRRSP